MDAYATWMWISAYAFQLVLLVAIVRGVIAFCKPLPSYSPLFRLWDRPNTRPLRPDASGIREGK